jgi:transglutaminase-like putative cysteine protease
MNSLVKGELVILEVQHETRLEYTEAVTEWIAEFRLEPVSDANQTCQSFHLKCNQSTSLFRYQDGFGNHVHHCNLRSPQREVRILAASLVETHPARRDLSGSVAVFPLELAGAPLETFDFLVFRGPVSQTPRLEPLLAAVRPAEGTPLAALVLNVIQYLRDHFDYARDVTNVSSPVEDVLRLGKGVCQDFAHLLIAVLRSLGVPARYVSGYIHRPNKESQSHAWCEAWLPDLGWVGLDPTNNCVVNEHFVKVAIGRDFTDVPPNKGVYRGSGEESIGVRVETRALERLPSLSWQEQLPPLQVPLMAIRKSLHREPTPAEEAQQQ